MAEVKIIKLEPVKTRCAAAYCSYYAQPRKKLCRSCEEKLTALEPAPARKLVIELDEREAQLLHVIIGGISFAFVKETFEALRTHYYPHIVPFQTQEVSKLTRELYGQTDVFRTPENGLD